MLGDTYGVGVCHRCGGQGDALLDRRGWAGDEARTGAAHPLNGV